MRKYNNNKPIATANVPVYEVDKKGYTNFKGSFKDGNNSYSLEWSRLNQPIQHRKNGKTIVGFIKVAKFNNNYSKF